MELNANINTFYKGLDLDSDISLLDKNSIRYAENIRLVANTDGTNSVLQNSDYIQKYNDASIVDKIVIATKEVKWMYTPFGSDKGEIKDGHLVITKSDVADSNGFKYSIYIVLPELSSRFTVVEGYFNWSDNLSIVHNYESDTVNKIYIADGVNPVRVINIAKLNQDGSDVSIFDIIPTATMQPLSFAEVTNGNLEAGKFQYAYQFFNEYGNGSTVSPLSDLIPISDTIGGNNQNSVKGSKLNTVTQKGIKLSTTIQNKNFDRIRIYRIFYKEAGQIPSVDIIDELKLSTGSSETQFEYTDYGSNFISSITIDEFNILSMPYDFVAKTLETKDNRLFAANIKEESWDVEYDARAYRANSKGEVLLLSATGDNKEFSLNDTEWPFIEEDHDCINPSNTHMFDEESFTYVYNKDGKLGGTGLNVSYDFTFVEVALSSQPSSYQNGIYMPAYNFKLDVERRDPSSQNRIWYFDESGNIQKAKNIVFNDGRSLIQNYSDPWMCTNVVGYMRDEIYRFGIVFYNAKGIPSPVHWIGDIRIPCDKIATVKNEDLIYPFKSGGASNSYANNIELNSYAIGVRFTVNNIPEEAVAYEIVRCPRTEDNRTIVMQAVVNGLLKPYFTNSDGEKVYNWTNQGSDKDLRPQPLINLSDAAKTCKNLDNTSSIESFQYYDIDKNYYELISPEICVDPINSEKNVANGKLCKMNWIYARTGFTTVDYGVVKTLAVGADKLYQMSGTLTDIEQQYILNQFYQNDVFVFFQNVSNQGISGVFKYYDNVRDYGAINSFNITDVLNPIQIATITTFADTKSFKQVIGNSTYINTSIGSENMWGRHGKNLIIETENAFGEGNNYYPANTDGSINSGKRNTGPIFNIKKNSSMYNSTNTNRLNDVYIGCNAYQNTELNEPVYCFGGDTYLCVLDYLNTAFTQEANDYNSGAANRIHTQCYIPFETSVNLNLLSNEQYHNTVNNTETDDSGNLINYGQNLIQNEPVSFAGYVQNEPQYVYNTIYSQQGNAIKFITKPMYAIDDLYSSNRILSSELKHNLEMSDSWTKFKVANYLDVDNKYGQITNLKTFGDKLYFFQDNAVGVASVNERSLITDNNMAELTLGTGGILVRYDYVGTTNGSSIVNDKSIVTSAYRLYWYDFNKNSICTIENGIQELSKVKKVQSYYNNAYKEGADRTKPISVFNKKYNEIWFKVLDKPLVFNETLNTFTSFYTHDFDFVFTFGNKITTLKDSDFYQHNETLDKAKITLPLISKLKIVVNDNFIYTKVFDNVMFYADFSGNVNNISALGFETKSQVTNVISADDIECREDTYRLSIPREKLTTDINNTSYAGRMRGKYLEEIYTFDCNDNKTFKIPYIKTTYRQSML